MCMHIYEYMPVQVCGEAEIVPSSTWALLRAEKHVARVIYLCVCMYEYVNMCACVCIHVTWALLRAEEHVARVMCFCVCVCVCVCT